MADPTGYPSPVWVMNPSSISISLAVESLTISADVVSEVQSFSAPSMPPLVNITSIAAKPTVRVESVTTPIGVSSIVFPVGVSSIAFPVAVSSIALPVVIGEVQSFSAPVGVSSIVFPVGVSSIAFPVAISSIALPVGVASIAFPVAVSSIAFPRVDVTSIAFPVGVSSIAFPVAVSSIALPVVISEVQSISATMIAHVSSIALPVVIGTLPARGTLVSVCSGVTATASAQVDCTGYKGLLVMWMSVGSAGATGQQTVVNLLDATGGTALGFHGLGTGVQSAVALTDGVAVLRAVTNFVRVEPTITDGCWRVIAIPVNVD